MKHDQICRNLQDPANEVYQKAVEMTKKVSQDVPMFQLATDLTHLAMVHCTNICTEHEAVVDVHTDHIFCLVDVSVRMYSTQAISLDWHCLAIALPLSGLIGQLLTWCDMCRLQSCMLSCMHKCGHSSRKKR